MNISKNKDKLLKMSQISEPDIRDIWIVKNDIKVGNSNLKDIVYKWDIPLYQKMIFRFRNCQGCIARFWNQVDPCNRQKLLTYYKIYDKSNDMMEFFAWIKNHIRTYDFVAIKNMYEAECKSKSKITDVSLKRFEESNAIQYFLESSTEYQNAILKYYALWLAQFEHKD